MFPPDPPRHLRLRPLPHRCCGLTGARRRRALTAVAAAGFTAGVLAGWGFRWLTG